DNKPSKFRLIAFEDIRFDVMQEWRVKRIFPKVGTGAFYGESQSFKSFGAMDVGLHVACGWTWAGRAVEQCPVVYIAAEGGSGLRKRKAGWEKKHKAELPDKVPFYLIDAAPNLGTGDEDLKELIASSESAGVRPGIIFVDTVAQSMGPGDENGAG